MLAPKTVKYSSVEGHTYKIFPNDLNSNGTVFGGLVMGILDRTALVVAERHSGQLCVTASVDALHFLAPAKQGEVLIIKAALNRAWQTSMEVGVKVVAENPRTHERRHIVSAYFTFVALDDEGHPLAVAPLQPETPLEKQRYREATLRRTNRVREAKERKALREQDDL